MDRGRKGGGDEGQIKDWVELKKQTAAM